MSDDVIKNMRARIAHCRHLASLTHNPEIIRVLTEMADQGEIDVRKLEEEAAQRHED